MKKHNQKINKLKQKFPRISRIITEKKVTLIWFLSSILLVPIGFATANTFSAYKQREAVYAQREKLQKDVVFWEEVVQKHSGYRDGYFTLALLEYRLGDKEKAKSYLDKSLALDPNFEKGRELEKLLQ